MEKFCDKIKGYGKTLEQGKEECKNLQIYLIKKLYYYDCWNNLFLKEILLKNIGMGYTPLEFAIEMARHKNHCT